jgi:hypothetical protein
MKVLVKPNSHAIWFNVQGINAATDHFIGVDPIGQGDCTTIYRGALSNSHRIIQTHASSWVASYYRPVTTSVCLPIYRLSQGAEPTKGET